MVSACAILLTGLLSRYAAINDRLRAMRRASPTPAGLVGERLDEIDAQIPLLLRHHKRAHDAVLAVYCASAVYIGDMFVIALGAATSAARRRCCCSRA